MTKTAPRGAIRDLTEALRLINDVRTAYDLPTADIQSLTALAVQLRSIKQDIDGRRILTASDAEA